MVQAARAAGAEAVHPGYGFLAENADFAAACADAGLVFVGPGADAIRLMGDKRLARRRMADAGLACVPGYDGDDQSDDRLVAEIERLGRPVMIKAAGGGGGRGLRCLEAGEDAAPALRGARSEAAAAFGSSDLIVEKALQGVRHVEVQVFADAEGRVIHLGERDCSVQRRHQKVIEEAPAPGVDAGLRAAMGGAAVDAARAVGYVGAGTVEFLLDGDGAFHFLEMNTRLQVEHPVTEAVCGIDLVEWQFRIAAGEPLPMDQDAVRLEGHAMEARLYAEDAAHGYLPQTGRIALWRPPAGARVDAGIAEGFEVGPHYDPLLAKIVVHGADREQARARLAAALVRTSVLGLTTNRDFLAAIVADPGFAAGAVTTDFLDTGPAAWPSPQPGAAMRALAAVLLFEVDAPGLDAWRNSGLAEWPVEVAWDGGAAGLRVIAGRDGAYTVVDGDAATRVALESRDGDQLRVEIDGNSHHARHAFDGPVLWLDMDGRCAAFDEPDPHTPGAEDAGDGRLVAPISGRVVALAAAAGDAVEAGACVVVLEAMKMEHEVRSPAPGRVQRLAVAEGDQVAAGALLAVVEAESGVG
jgi:geranyl-CoA carboxylase alpha subunit